MGIVRLDHVQLAMPAGLESDAVAFYEGVLGIPHEPLDGYDRVYVTDPFGNRIELMQPTDLP